MNKENKLLLIFAGVFLVIGLVGSLLISSYSDSRTREKIVLEYQDLLPADKVDVKKYKNKSVKTSYKFYNEHGTDIGTVYIGEGYATGIYYYAQGENEAFDKNEKYIFEFEVYVRQNGIIGAIRIKENEHTPDFVSYVEQYFEALVGVYLSNYLLVDEVAGASDFTMPIVREVLADIADIHLEEPPVQPEPLEPHEELFGKGSTMEDVEFTGNDTVIGKKAIKDADGNLLGYGYVAKATSGPDITPKNATVTLMVAVNAEGKIIGLLTVDSEHTPGFYNQYRNNFDSFIDTNVSDLNVDVIANATITGDVLNVIFDAVKEVILNE